MHTFQNHVVFQSFSDLYREEKRQDEEGSSKSSNCSSNVSRASSFSYGVASSYASTGYNLSRTTTQSSNESSAEPQYYPAALYHSRIARNAALREIDTVTLNDEESSSQDLSLKRY
ncbi:hypothetical protein CBS101457_000841 [Exobasidium rhododendri]|nr:hypothetical protein CBS101457_000841 [Exobasidium rhododendri]